MGEVVVSIEKVRGCGHRKPAKDGVGIYLVGPSVGAPCGRLPFELPLCPTCGGGVHPARGWQWFEPKAFFEKEGVGIAKRLTIVRDRCREAVEVCERCPVGLAVPEGKHGLIWIGETHYPTPDVYLEEARQMGVSRKIKAVPKGFELGRTVVYLAHRKAVPKGTIPEVPPDADGKGRPAEERFAPGIFSVFRPTGIDLVIDDEKNVPEKALKLAEQHGARIVKVVPEDPGAPFPTNADEGEEASRDAEG